MTIRPKSMGSFHGMLIAMSTGMHHLLLMTVYSFCLSLSLAACVSEDADRTSQSETEKADAIGNGELGESCRFNLGCRSDKNLICRPSQDSSVTPDKRCQLLAENGELCGEDADCSAGHHCNTWRVCAPGVAEGCWFDFQCGSGEQCRPSSFETDDQRRCQEGTAALGEPCIEDEHCTSAICRGTLFGNLVLISYGECETL